MSDKIIVVHPDGTTTKIKRTSSCGCVTVLLFMVVVFGPLAWFPWPVAAAIYLALAGALVAAVIHQLKKDEQS